MIKKDDFLFVYGTLRVGERADLSRSQNEFGVTYIGSDNIVGEIYDTGNGYPGLKIAGDKPVVGDLFLVRDNSIGAFLDAYEGYPSLYSREKVKTTNGETAWVYTYNHPVIPEALIPSGDWKERKQEEPAMRVSAQTRRI